VILLQTRTLRVFAAAAIALLLGLAVLGCVGGERSGSPGLLLLAAASTEGAVLEAVAGFEQRSGSTVSVSTGGSNALAQQVIAGAPAQLFLSANQQWADAVAAEGLVVASVPLLSNRLVVVVPLGNPAGIRGLEDLTADRVDRVAIAAESVPAGIYAHDALASLFLLEELEAGKKLVRGQDVRQTLAFVERGEVDAGVVYRTDAAVSQSVEVIEVIDLALHDAIVYPLMLLVDNDRARSLYDFLQTDAALEAFERHGFDRVHSLTLTRSRVRFGEGEQPSALAASFRP
jgi:molybdate transport system substrate-binding protein